MPTRSVIAFAVALFALLLQAPAHAESSGWLSMEEFRASVTEFVQKGKKPTKFAVRVRDGKAEFIANWEDKGFFSYSFTVHESRDAAEAVVEEHRDPGPGMIDKLCVAKFARARDGGKEYWMLFLVDPEQSGIRCRKMPSS